MQSPHDARVIDTAVIGGVHHRLEHWPQPRGEGFPPSVDHFCIVDDLGPLYAFHAEPPAWREWTRILKAAAPPPPGRRR